MHHKSQRYFFGFIALLAGALVPFGFAPISIYIIPVIGLAIFYWLLRRASAGQGFLRGFLFGIGFFGVGVSWVYISIHRFGGVNSIVAGLITGLFISVLALFPALLGVITSRAKKKKWLVFPAGWVLLEGLRSVVFTGFPWLLLGHSQVYSPLAGYAPILGVYGVSFLIALTAVLLIFSNSSSKKYRLLCFGSIFLIWGFGTLLRHMHWTYPFEAPMKASLIQGNIPQQLKWVPEQIRPTLRTYEVLSEENFRSDLIIWPEAAIPLSLSYVKQYTEHLAEQAKAHHAALIVGVPIDDHSNFYNGAVVLGEGQGQYLKRHLVPFGEYVPLQKIAGSLFKWLDVPMSDFSVGPRNPPLMQAKNLRLGVYICYEIAYSPLLLEDLPEANLLVVMSNDAWFGHSWAGYQHLEIAQFAALASGREVIFVSNDGVTALIQSNGDRAKSLPRFTKAVLTGDIQPRMGETPWVDHGDKPVFIFCALLMLASVFL